MIVISFVLEGGERTLEAMRHGRKGLPLAGEERFSSSTESAVNEGKSE